MVLFHVSDYVNRRWGRFIATYPWTHILLSLLCCIIMSAQLWNMEMEHDIRASFSPANSRFTHESAVYREFFNLSVLPQRAFIMFSAKDHGSILRVEQLKEVFKLDDYFTSVLRKRDNATGMRGCDPICETNKPFRKVAEKLISSYENASQTDDFIFDYPTATYKGINLFIGMNMIGTRRSEHLFPQNSSHVTFSRMLIFWYFFRADTVESKRIMREVTLDLFNKADEGSTFRHVNYKIFGDEVANSEMVRGAVEATLLMSIGGFLLVLFVTMVVFYKLKRLTKRAVPLIVAVAILCPLLGCSSAFGLSTLIGNKTYTIMCVIPFLVIGIGVDDCFLLLHSWTQHSKVRNRSERLSVVFIHVGSSITITSLTNSVAFFVGYFTPTPQMSLFCLCCSCAILVDYILTFTLLAPILYLSTPDGKADNDNFAIKAFIDKSEQPEENARINSLIIKYSKMLNSSTGRLTALLTMVLLYAFCLLGVLKMKSTFEPSKAFPSDSALAHATQHTRELFNEFFPVNIIVNRPPIISNHSEYKLFYEMIDRLEQLPEAYGGNHTLLWLKPYEILDRHSAQLLSYLGYQNMENYVPTYENVDFFLEQSNYPPTIKFKTLSNGKKVVTAFHFTLIVSNMAEWANRALFEERCREIIRSYPLFNATLYDGDSPILNMLLTVKLDLFGSILVTIICMIVVCSFFISHQIGVVIIAFTISSICFTLVGTISWWGADMDPITLVDCLMAAGFSVDYTAHVAHQFYAKSGDPVSRIARSLEEMAAPMSQAGISTVLCMLPLIFVPTYAIVAFAKTIFAVVFLGLLHGVFLMPVFLCLVPNASPCSQRLKTREPPAHNVDSSQPFLGTPNEGVQ